jgi:hypothetical protein
LCAEDTTGGGGIDARRERIGMMKIIDHLGTASGIDAALYANTNIGAAQKIISIAGYPLSTNGQSLPGIQTWQYNHQIPYAEGLSENVYHDLFKEIGSDESLQRNFFASRCAGLGGSATVAYDSTTFSTYSENQVEARYGFNKTGDSLKTVKYLTLYSLETRQPIAFTKQPGNIPDVITVGNALSQLSVLGIENAELVTDNGYYSESNLADMFMSHFNFITLVKTSLKWVRSEIDAHVDELEKLRTGEATGEAIFLMPIRPFDSGHYPNTYAQLRQDQEIRQQENRHGQRGPGNIQKEGLPAYIF